MKRKGISILSAFFLGAALTINTGAASVWATAPAADTTANATANTVAETAANTAVKTAVKTAAGTATKTAVVTAAATAANTAVETATATATKTAVVTAAALTANTTTNTAANTASQTTAPENAEPQASDTPEEPQKPESYEWEIQSNKISGWPQGPKVIAETAILMDVDSGEILYAKGIDEKRAPASTTKIMTAMLAIEKVPFDTQITFTNEVNNIEPGSTHIGIKPGETLTMKDSIYAILLASANEVSSGVAEYIGGNVPAFVEMMNQRAKELGCENTHFVNANGLYSEDHYTTARDLAVISRAAFQNETFREIVKTPYYIVPKTNITNEERWLNNHHKMVLDGAEHYEGCLGGKTGYTEKAGNTLVTYAERDGMKLVCVVLADTNAHYEDTKAILDYGFSNFKKETAASIAPAAQSSDAFSLYLEKEGLLKTVFENSSIDVPAESKEDITFKASLDSHTLSVDYYYGDSKLAAFSQEAPLEILDAEEAFAAQHVQTSQTDVKTDSDENSSDNAKSGEDSGENASLKGFGAKALSNFRELPNWKYPALLLFTGAFLFYLVTLVVKIRRASRRRKRRKLRTQQKERKSS